MIAEVAAVSIIIIVRINISQQRVILNELYHKNMNAETMMGTPLDNRPVQTSNTHTTFRGGPSPKL